MIKLWETKQETICPVNGWNCPYYGEHGICTRKNVIENVIDVIIFILRGLIK